MLTILCIATYLKGEAFLRECRQATERFYRDFFATVPSPERPLE